MRARQRTPKSARGELVEPRQGDAPFDKLRANGVVWAGQRTPKSARGEPRVYPEHSRREPRQGERGLRARQRTPKSARGELVEPRQGRTGLYGRDSGLQSPFVVSPEFILSIAEGNHAGARGACPERSRRVLPAKAGIQGRRGCVILMSGTKKNPKPLSANLPCIRRTRVGGYPGAGRRGIRPW